MLNFAKGVVLDFLSYVILKSKVMIIIKIDIVLVLIFVSCAKTARTVSEYLTKLAAVSAPPCFFFGDELGAASFTPLRTLRQTPNSLWHHVSCYCETTPPDFI